MKTYIYADKNSSNSFVTSQESEQDAWQAVVDTFKDVSGWRLAQIEDEEDWYD